MAVGTISAAELQARLEDPEPPQVIDIRHPTAFAGGHIPGAENVPFVELIHRIDAVSWADQIVVVCPHGESSQQAVQLIDAYAGVDGDAAVLNLTGGYAAWTGPLVAEPTD
jgi:rhodanese-related sulfurtransferase